jgi:hypothetical protein
LVEVGLDITGPAPASAGNGVGAEDAGHAQGFIGQGCSGDPPGLGAAIVVNCYADGGSGLNRRERNTAEIPIGGCDGKADIESPAVVGLNPDRLTLFL